MRISMSGHTPLPPTPVALPLLPLRDIVVFPHMGIPLFVGRDKSIRGLENAISGEKRIVLADQKKPKTNDPAPEDIYDIGTAAEMLQILRLSDGTDRKS